MNVPFTVLLTLHQRDDIEDNFESLIQSIYTNTLLPNNILILVDGPISSNFQLNIENQKKIKKFDVYYHHINIGLANILNIGLKKIHTPWAIRVDGDDICLPHRFKKTIECIHSEISIVGGYIKEIDENKVTRIKKVPLQYQNIKSYLKYRNPFNHPTVAFRVDHVLSVGGYPNLYLKEDYGLWVKMISKGYQGINIPEILVETSFNKASYQRRSGINYLKSDISLAIMQYNLKNINKLEFFFILVLRTITILSPSFLKILIYQFLRRI